MKPLIYALLIPLSLMGGDIWAAKVGADDIKKGAVRSKQIKDGKVKLKDLHPDVQDMFSGTGAGHLMVNPASAVQTGGGSDLDNGGNRTSGRTLEVIEAHVAVDLPDQVRLIRVTVYFTDTDPDADATIILSRAELISDSEVEMASVKTSGSMEAVQVLVTEVIQLPNTDLRHYSFLLRMELAQDFVFHGALLDYEH